MRSTPRSATRACTRRARPRAGELRAALDKIRHWHGSDGTLPLLKLPGARDDLALLKPHAERFAKFEHVVVMGTGGSSLSGKTLVALKDQGFGPLKGRPKLWFMDNVDPATFDGADGAPAARSHRLHRRFPSRAARRRRSPRS